MEVDFKNFIGIFNNVYPEGYCQHIVKEFDRLAELGVGHNRQQGRYATTKHRKDDYAMEFSLVDSPIYSFEDRNIVSTFFDGLQECYNEYTEKYSILAEHKLNAYYMKAQRTQPGGGYHVWHSEKGNGPPSQRGLVYMLYLNTLEPEDGGETEFLYQRERYRPIENTMLIWPADFSHAHRGNTVLGTRDKYIITGWFYYAD